MLATCSQDDLLRMIQTIGVPTFAMDVLDDYAFRFVGINVNQRRRHLFERRHARRSLVIGRGRICPWLETSERSDQAAAR
jgi:hypothetical protein